MIKSTILPLILILFCAVTTIAQGLFTWFEPNHIYAEKHMYSDCYIAKDSKIEDKQVIEFEARPLFIYNHPQLRKWMKNEFLMEGEAFVSKVGENHFLIINYYINSENAKNNYGDLGQGGKMKVSLINGDHLYLENIERDRGKVKKKANRTVYTGTYAIDREDLKKLKRFSLDKINVLWEEGVEEYLIQNIDLVKQQLNCLNE